MPPTPHPTTAQEQTRAVKKANRLLLRRANAASLEARRRLPLAADRRTPIGVAIAYGSVERELRNARGYLVEIVGAATMGHGFSQRFAVVQSRVDALLAEHARLTAALAPADVPA